MEIERKRLKKERNKETKKEERLKENGNKTVLRNKN